MSTEEAKRSYATRRKGCMRRTGLDEQNGTLCDTTRTGLRLAVASAIESWRALALHCVTDSVWACGMEAGLGSSTVGGPPNDLFSETGEGREHSRSASAAAGGAKF